MVQKYNGEEVWEIKDKNKIFRWFLAIEVDLWKRCYNKKMLDKVPTRTMRGFMEVNRDIYYDFLKI